MKTLLKVLIALLILWPLSGFILLFIFYVIIALKPVWPLFFVVYKLCTFLLPILPAFVLYSQLRKDVVSESNAVEYAAVSWLTCYSLLSVWWTIILQTKYSVAAVRQLGYWPYFAAVLIALLFATVVFRLKSWYYSRSIKQKSQF